MRRLLALPLWFVLFASTSYAGNAALAESSERVLFPIWTDGPVSGANGSLWSARVLINNASSESVVVFPIVNNYGTTSGAIPPRTSWDMDFSSNAEFGGSSGDYPGRIAYVSRDGASSLVYQDRLINTSPFPSGSFPVVDIPVVRERDLHTSTIALSEVPLDPRFRLMLRVYDPFQTSDAQVVVRFWAEFLANNIDTLGGGLHRFQPPTLIGTQTLSLKVIGAFPGNPNVYPGYAQTIIDPRQLPPIPDYSRSIVVEIEPVTPNLQFWAFVTATNNETQQVLVIAPH